METSHVAPYFRPRLPFVVAAILIVVCSYPLLETQERKYLQLVDCHFGVTAENAIGLTQTT